LNKKETKGKTKAKFEIVQEILPLIAEKSAKIVGKDVPSLNGTITKIMNVVWIDDTIKFENKKHKIKITVYNYTPKSQSFSLHLVVPQGSIQDKKVDPIPSEMKDGQKITWELRRLSSTAKVEIALELTGLEAEAYEENELYSSGINPIFIIGADPLPGDWDVEALAVTEVDVSEAPEDLDEEEVDYDEQAEVLNDEQ
ncbi:MAG: DNA topoisomerase VI subunit B, partial [Methanomassiliicoccales archaeon]|nr:DNA topoisomerase VI subunit B [Methanomassiliicoccales archaeon]